jgi:transketolase
VIIAHTIPGKGVDFMEYDFRWHGYDLDPNKAKELADYRKALDELRTVGGKIHGEHE